MPDPVSRVSRRAFVTVSAGTVTALALTGCDAVESVFDGDGNGSDPDSPTAAAVDADSTLVDEVGRAIARAAALALATGKAVPALRTTGARLGRIHLSHGKELGRTETVAAPRVKGNRSVALRALLRSETALQKQLVAAALRAESGALAQVFASMAAALAQQRKVLT